MLGAQDSHEILGKNVLDLIHPEFRRYSYEKYGKRP